MRAALGSLIALAVSFAQPGTPAFEVASVKPAAPLTEADKAPGPRADDPGILRYRRFPFKSLLQQAYDLPAAQISGPGWLETESYDIVAKIPAGASKDQINLMLRNLLAQRLGLVTHMETREGAIYEATVAKGGARVRTPEKPPAGGQPGITRGEDGLPVLPPGEPRLMAFATAGSMHLLARMQTLHNMFRMLQYQLGRPVLDKTGLEGIYDFELTYAANTAGPQLSGTSSEADDSGLTLLDAMERQLGVRLQAKKGPFKMLVVDRANRTPTED